MSKAVSCSCLRCGAKIRVYAAHQRADPDGLMLLCARCRARIAAESVPVARIRTSWWRRLIAWFTSEDISRYCARCHARVGVDEDAELHERICEWCHRFGYPFTDPDDIDEQDREVHASAMRHAVYGKSVPMPDRPDRRWS